MPRPKKVTVEKIEKIIKGMKRIKAHQARKEKIGERSDGQTIYHYPSISKAKIAKVLNVNASYLTSLQKENYEIAHALKRVGQRRSNKMEDVIHEPKIGTKAYLERKVKRQGIKITKLESQLKAGRSRLIHTKKVEKAHEGLVDQMNSMTDELRAERKKNIELKSIISGLRMTNSSLTAMIAKRE